MNRNSLSRLARRHLSTLWQWITRRPHPLSFAVAIGAGILAWFADHSLLSVGGSALIAFALAHLIGPTGITLVSFSLACSWLPDVLLNRTESRFHPIGVMTWMKIVPALLVGAISILWFVGGLIGGAILVGEGTERLLGQKGQAQPAANDKAVKSFYLVILATLFTTIFLGITVLVLSLFGQI